MFHRKQSFFSHSFLITFLLHSTILSAQTNLLLNGSFEDINVCTEYKAECGVEGWFYLQDVKAQMLADYDPVLPLGANSYGLYYKWAGYKGFTPVIGTILPCRLQKGKRYIFSGMFSALLNGRLNFKPGIVVGEKFYVPNRPFSKNMHPDSIIQLTSLKRKDFYRFEYSFVAEGTEKYLTFGTFIEEDTIAGKRTFIGTQSVSLVLDNFQLIPEDHDETFCRDFMGNKENIYHYNFRHKEMDYSLYGKGDLDIYFDVTDSNYITRKKPGEKPVKADTLKLSDVLFDFNKADLKPGAFKMLETFFKPGANDHDIDSIYIEGHTDSIGSDSRNQQLSTQRCESVESWLLLNNILDKKNIQIHPFGKTRPVATNSTPQGRTLNRRVEMIIFRKTRSITNE